MTSKLRHLFEVHGLFSLRKQRALAALLGPHTWDFDAATGTLKFSRDRHFRAQILGVEVGPPAKRLWCWAHDEAAGVAPEHRRAADQLKTFGEKEQIEEFVVPRLPRERMEGQLLGCVALGVLPAPGFYRGLLGDTATLFVIDDPDYPELPSFGAAEFVMTLRDAFSQYEFRNHRQAVESFLAQLGWEANWSPSGFEIQAEDGVLVLGSFDERDRLHKLSSRAPAET